MINQHSPRATRPAAVACFLLGAPGNTYAAFAAKAATATIPIAFMMVAEVVGGLLFGSIALVADGLHMSTHASALVLAALAYRYARHYADDAIRVKTY